MWTLKFKAWHEDCLIRPLCQKNNVTDLVYMINSWKEKNKFFYSELHILEGKKENREAFAQEMVNLDSCEQLESHDDFIFTLNKRPIHKKHASPVFDPRIIQLKPTVQRKDGYEDWHLASWDKSVLTKVLDIPQFKTEIKCIKKENLKDIYMPRVFPRLPPKQKEALQLAIKNGYYQYPKNVTLENLAKKSGVKRQTFRENLRKAEQKLMPFFSKSQIHNH